MPDKKLERIAQRLEKMQARNDELREQLAARVAEAEQMAVRHADEERRLTDQLMQLRNTQQTERTAYTSETAAIENRRKELKEDYGDLKSAFDQLGG